MKHLVDITKINGAEIPVVDVITGGSPCQDISVAGKRAGLAGERSGLFMEQIRIVKEMREHDVRSGRNPAHARPRYMVWENVPGAFSSGSPKGADFAAVLEEIIKTAEPGADVCVRVPDNGWTKSGFYYADDGTWSIAWRVHDAQFWGVPQRRKRIALVADFGGLSAPEVLFERKGLSRDPQPGGEARQETTGAAGDGAESAISFQERAGKPGGGKGILIQNERTGALSTLNNQAVIQPILLESNQNHATIQTDGISTTLPASMGMGGGYVPINQISLAEQANTLDTMHDQQAVIVFDKEMYNCGKNCDGAPQAKTDTVAPTVRADDHPSGVVSNATVRRLTPLECERLQGYPDGWTEIGDWVDSKGKKHKAADSPRYKALGNSIALPFWFWLLRRISAQYERPANLGSLFDGIGGFPLCWERCNGKGTALWASEIEEFPIAVTKIRFNDD